MEKSIEDKEIGGNSKTHKEKCENGKNQCYEWKITITRHKYSTKGHR